MYWRAVQSLHKAMDLGILAILLAGLAIDIAKSHCIEGSYVRNLVSSINVFERSTAPSGGV